MRKIGFFTLHILTCFIFLFFLPFATLPTYAQRAPSNPASGAQLDIIAAKVIEVIAIDMIRVEVNGEKIDVHLIGITAPSDDQLRNYFNNHREKVQNTIESTLLNATVFLVSENNEATVEVEPWERYVFLKDMTFINETFLKQGLALHDKTLEINRKYNDEFAQFQKEAQQTKKGIWFIDPATPTVVRGNKRESTKIISPIITTRISSTLSPTSNTPLTPMASPTVKPTNTPTQTPQPTATSVPTVLSSAVQNSPKDSLNSEKIFTLINEYRKSKNLPLLEKSDYLCQIANTRAPQLYDEIFVTYNVHAGFYAMNVPYWITENMAHYQSEQEIMNWWLSSSIHRQAIEGIHSYTCGACYGNSCVQLFTSFIKK